MFKTLFVFVILGFFGLLVWAIYKIISTADVKSTTDGLDIDKIISDLEIKLEIAEAQSELGLEEAKLRVEVYSEKLKKAKELKSKINKN